MANYLHRITSLSNFVTFSRVFIPLTRQQSTVNLRKQLTFYNFTSQAPFPLYSSRYIVDSRFTVKSLHSRSRFSPERAYFSGSFRSKARAFSSKELRLTEVRNLKVLCQGAFYLRDCSTRSRFRLVRLPWMEDFLLFPPISTPTLVWTRSVRCVGMEVSTGRSIIAQTIRQDDNLLAWTPIDPKLLFCSFWSWTLPWESLADGQSIWWRHKPNRFAFKFYMKHYTVQQNFKCSSNTA